MSCNRQKIDNSMFNNYDNYRLNSNLNLNSNINTVFPKNVMYGHAYVKNQNMNTIFSPEEGLRKGTLFPELVSQYEPGDSMLELLYLRGGNR